MESGVELNQDKMGIYSFWRKVPAKCPIFKTIQGYVIQGYVPILKLDFIKIEFQSGTRVPQFFFIV